MRGIREKHSRTRGVVRWAGGSRVHRGAPCCMLEALTQRTGGCHEHARPWWYCRSHRRHYPDLYRAPATRSYLDTSQYIFGKRCAPTFSGGDVLVPISGRSARPEPAHAATAAWWRQGCMLGALLCRASLHEPFVAKGLRQTSERHRPYEGGSHHGTRA